MSLIGKQAPHFSAKAVVKDQFIDLDLSSFQGKYVMLFFYPLDFTFVCPTELHAFQERLGDIEKRDAQLIGCSVDSHFCHHAWLQVPKSKGGIQGIEYPLVADINKTIARDYDVLIEEEGIAYRGLFLIDKGGIIRHLVVNDLPLGRSVDEALRMLDALIHFEKYGEVCPANWQIGKASLKPTAKGLEQFFTR